jgi:hypothetical protein
MVTTEDTKNTKGPDRIFPSFVTFVSSVVMKVFGYKPVFCEIINR